MNELAKSEKTMSSRTIAELTGKLHNHVMRDIKNMEDAYVEVFGRESKFGLSSYQAGNRYYPEYMLTISDLFNQVTSHIK